MEKRQVQLATAGGLLIVYLLLWSSLRAWDPAAPVSIVAKGGYAAFGVVALTVLALAAVCGVITVGLRPASALLATLIGAAAVSIRSPSIRALLWSHQDQFDMLFAKLIGEVLLLASLVACASLIIYLIHRVASRLNPKWGWRERADKLAGKQEDDEYSDAGGADAASPPLLLAVIRVTRLASVEKAKRRQATAVVVQALYCIGLGTLIAIAMVLVVMKSSDRGQIIFALLVSSFVAAFAAYEIFPARSNLPGMAMVVLSAVALYALAAVMSISGIHNAWTGVKPFGQALPIDWLTAGGGGALLGYWVSSRAKEVKHGQQIEEKAARAKGE